MFHLGADDAAPAWCLTEHLNFLVRNCKSCQLELRSLAQMYCKVASWSAVFGSNVLQSCQLELRSLAQMYCKVASSVISRTWVLDCPRRRGGPRKSSSCFTAAGLPRPVSCPGEPAGPASGESHGPWPLTVMESTAASCCTSPY